MRENLSEMDRLYLDLYGYSLTLPVLPPEVGVTLTYDYKYSMGGVRMELRDTKYMLAKSVRESIEEPVLILSPNESKGLVKRGVGYTRSNLEAIFTALGFREAKVQSFVPSYDEPRYKAHASVDLYPTEQGVPSIGYLPGDILDHLGDVVHINGDILEEMTTEVREASNTLYRLRENNEVPASMEAVSALRTLVGFAQRTEARGWSVKPGNTKRAEEILFSMAVMVQKDGMRRNAVEQRIKYALGEV
jgi:hypothetical protein